MGKKKIITGIVFVIVIVLVIVIYLIFWKSRYICGTRFICADGSVLAGCDSSVLEKCPSSESCSMENHCIKEGYDCYKFENEEPYCYYSFLNNPCLKCKSKKCSISESYPMQVICE